CRSGKIKTCGRRPPDHPRSTTFDNSSLVCSRSSILERSGAAAARYNLGLRDRLRAGAPQPICRREPEQLAGRRDPECVARRGQGDSHTLLWGVYMAEVIYAGVDVSKETLDVALHPSGEYWQEKNDEAGRTRLIARLENVSPELVVLEATGGFERSAAIALTVAALPVVVINPRQVREFARATGELSKT